MGESFFTETELRNLRAISVEEVGELIERLKDGCAGVFGADCCDDDVARDIHALFHTITGSAGVTGFTAISELASEAESATAEENLPLSAAAMERILEIIGRIEELLDGEQFS